MFGFMQQVLQSSRNVLLTQRVMTASKLTSCSSKANLFSEVLVNFQQISIRERSRSMKKRVFKPIRGGGRPTPFGVLPPKERTYGFRPVLPEDGKYTTKPLPVIRMGGRDPILGKVVVKTIGGGRKKQYRWVDYKREAPKDGSVLEEKVYDIRYDACRSAKIALVASGDHKRWIIAAESTKVGDIIRTHGTIPRNPVRPEDGDAYPLGALPQGTLVHNIEVSPGSGGLFCRAAGTAAQVIRRVDDKCVVQLPSKDQILIHERCMAVAGRASNIEHGSIQIGSPNKNRWLGHRPCSGLWHRKDGYCGRKIHPPKGIKDFFTERPTKPEVYKLTLDNEE